MTKFGTQKVSYCFFFKASTLYPIDNLLSGHCVLWGLKLCESLFKTFSLVCMLSTIKT